MNRSVVIGLVLAALVALGAVFFLTREGDPVIAQAPTETESSAPGEEGQPPAANPGAEAEGANVSELMEPGPLPDIALGEADAPVTIVEYASLTCPHCATFHRDTWPVLKERFVDKGQVRYVFREFPLDNYATAGFMLARCSEEQNYYPIIEAFFAQQDGLLSAPDPFAWIQNFGRQVGFTQESLEACLGNQELLDNVMGVRQRASERFGVNSTPTFFINGKIRRGALSIEELEKEIAAHVPS